MQVSRSYVKPQDQLTDGCNSLGGEEEGKQYCQKQWQTNPGKNTFKFAFLE